MATNIPEHIWIHVFSLTGHMTFSNFFNILSLVSDHNNEDSNGLYLTGGCEHRMTEQGSLTGQLGPVPVESGHWGLLWGGAPTGASLEGKAGCQRGQTPREEKALVFCVSFSLFRHHLEGWSCAVCFLQLNQCQPPVQVPCSFSEGRPPPEFLC